MEFMMLTFTRTNELILAQWNEFDFNERVWSIPAERMKMKRPHLVPLSKQALTILEQLKKINGNRDWVFPSYRTPKKPMSNNAILMALDRMGYGGIKMPTQKSIVFATTGSLGDLHPFIAVGRALQARGHSVTVATTRAHRHHVAAAGLAFYHMRPDPWDTSDFAARFTHASRGPRFVFEDYLSPAIDQSYDDLRTACSNAELLISQSLALAAPLVAEVTGIKWISAVFQPFTLFSIYDPPLLPHVPFVKHSSLLAAQYNQRIMHYVKKHTLPWTLPVESLRRKLQLPPAASPIYEGQHAPHKVLAMFSPLLGAPQPDWPVQTIQTGAALYNQGTELDGSLQNFLDAGTSPLVFTLGTSSCRHPGVFFARSLQAAKKLGRRALLLTGGDPALNYVSTGSAVFNYAPYDQVFSRAAAIVHSGGIGTTMQALQAGKPQLIVPFAHDQADNARRIKRLGAGQMLAKQHYTAGRAGRMLKHLLTSDTVKQTATALAAKAACENGVARAVAAIEQTLHG